MSKENYIGEMRKSVDDLRWEYLHPTLESDGTVASVERYCRARQHLFEKYTWALYDLVSEHLHGNGWYISRGNDDPGRWRWDACDQQFRFEYRVFPDLMPVSYDRFMLCSVSLYLDPDVDLDQELARLVKEAEVYRGGVKAMEAWVRDAHRCETADRSPPTEDGYQIVQRILMNNESFDDFSAVLDNPPPNDALKADDDHG